MNICLIKQERKLKSKFPGSITHRIDELRDYFSWSHTIQPSPLSAQYKILLEYSKLKGVEVFVIEPKLLLAKGEIKLPHTYNTLRQQLCLYYPDYGEWHRGLLFSETIVPWACEWLLFYELWLITGEWHGGGIH